MAQSNLVEFVSATVKVPFKVLSTARKIGWPSAQLLQPAGPEQASRILNLVELQAQANAWLCPRNI